VAVQDVPAFALLADTTDTLVWDSVGTYAVWE
jgi:hypothetical protein